MIGVRRVFKRVLTEIPSLRRLSDIESCPGNGPGVVIVCSLSEILRALRSKYRIG